MAMRKAVKKLWLKALRSGKYKQTKGALKDKDGFCCLGVLCDVHQKQMKKNYWKRPKGSHCYGYGKKYDNAVLTPRVMKWANLKVDNPYAGKYVLSAWNDEKKADFNKIADLIEKHL